MDDDDLLEDELDNVLDIYWHFYTVLGIDNLRKDSYDSNRRKAL